MEKFIEKNHYLNQVARDGYKSYIQAYASHSLKEIFNIDALDMAAVAKAFGFSVPPRVNISTGATKQEKKRDYNNRNMTSSKHGRCLQH